MPPAVADILTEFAHDPRVTWAVGAFGAIAEFSRDADEPAEVAASDSGLSVMTPRGALRVDFDPAARLVPYVSLSKLPDLWSQGIVACLPATAAGMAGRTALTDLGPDPAGGVRFDLGLGAANVDCLIRTADPALLETLGAAAGRDLFEDGNPALAAVVAASPERLFASRLARVAVSGPIPAADGVTAPGPHTHVLPDLLAHGRTHAATVPVPDGWLPVLSVFPPNPCRDAAGEPRRFDAADHAVFRAVYDAFAPAEIVAARARAEDLIRAGQGPDGFPEPETREARTALRVLLRELGHLQGVDTDALRDWRDRFEPADRSLSRSY